MPLRLAETDTSTWFYHLVESESADDEIKQGALLAICGAAFNGWETRIPLSTWGLRNHIPSGYCPNCTAKVYGKKET